MKNGKSPDFRRAMQVMKVRILTPLLILVWAASVLAQDNHCSLKLADLPDAPELFGFRMGMTTDQVKARVPQVVFGKTDEFVASKTSINPDFDPRINKSTLAGVRTVSLDFLDDRLASLWFGYDSTFKWSTVPDFVKGISESLHLPNAWSSWKTRGQQLRCADFQMTVTMMGEGASLRIIDSTAEQTLADRREAKEQRDSEEEQSSAGIVADKQSKVYYTENCRPENEIKETDRVVFKTSEDAEKAGYKRAKQCQ
jgi:hypothetical protein